MKGIQNLGKLDGMSYLDWFRKVITCLGNTLGFVRMIWTASMKDLTGTIKFIPKEAVFANYSEILKIITKMQTKILTFMNGALVSEA